MAWNTTGKGDAEIRAAKRKNRESAFPNNYDARAA